MAYEKYSYNNDYTRDNYDRINLIVPKGKREVIKAKAAERGVSVSQLVIDALEGYYKLDLSKRNGE